METYCGGLVLVIILIAFVVWLDERRDRREFVLKCEHWQKIDRGWRPGMEQRWKEYREEHSRSQISSLPYPTAGIPDREIQAQYGRMVGHDQG